MSRSSGHPFRRLLIVLLAIGAVVAVRNATAERGGSYDPTAETGHDPTAESGHGPTAETGHGPTAESGHGGVSDA